MLDIQKSFSKLAKKKKYKKIARTVKSLKNYENSKKSLIEKGIDDFPNEIGSRHSDDPGYPEEVEGVKWKDGVEGQSPEERAE